MKYSFFVFISVLVLISCSQKQSDKNSKQYVPKLVLVDSMRIDRLVVPTLLDYSDDAQKFLLFDFKSNEFILTDNSGNILKVANRAQDGPDSYKSKYFTAAQFMSENQILIETYAGTYIYDLDFNLLEARVPNVTVYTRFLGNTPSLLISDAYQYKFGYIQDDSDKIFSKDGPLVGQYDFLKTLDLKGNVLFEAPIPSSVNFLQFPGGYFSYEANSLIKDDLLYLQFLMTPKVYIYQFPELILVDSLELKPGKDFKVIKPSPGDNFGAIFEELRGSTFSDFTISNEYLITWYLKGTPDEEVDALDRRVVGDEKYMSVEEKYKTPIYQIFKDDKKLWEGEWPIKLQAKKELLYSVNAKFGEDPNAEERDFQTFYFYELK
ncbi:hypothetical protein [Algoriphagus algorifonticola]|uniref:hypothetical protein n=1 Tax=Algoriphagus algorifonticola TaxID=2593007 RepID=UPI0011A7C5E8|nr:hypothetical protein [Algoriphagus algorifonticola]